MRERTGLGFTGEPSVEAEIRNRIKNFKHQEGSLNHSCDYPKVAGGFFPQEKTSHTAAKLATRVLDPKSNSRRSIEDIFQLADRDFDQEGNDFINKSNLNKFVIPCIDPELENIFYKASIETIPYFDLINPSTDNNTIKDFYTVLYRETTDSAGTEMSFEEYDTTSHTFGDHLSKGKHQSKQQQSGLGHGSRPDQSKPRVSREGSTRGRQSRGHGTPSKGTMENLGSRVNINSQLLDGGQSSRVFDGARSSTGFDRTHGSRGFDERGSRAFDERGSILYRRENSPDNSTGRSSGGRKHSHNRRENHLKPSRNGNSRLDSRHNLGTGTPEMGHHSQ